MTSRGTNREKQAPPPPPPPAGAGGAGRRGGPAPPPPRRSIGRRLGGSRGGPGHGGRPQRRRGGLPSLRPGAGRAAPLLGGHPRAHGAIRLHRVRDSVPDSPERRP